MSRTEVAIDEAAIGTAQLWGVAVAEPALLSLLRDESFGQAWEARQIIKEEGDRCVSIIRAEEDVAYLLKSRQPKGWKRMTVRLCLPLAREHSNLDFLVQRNIPVARGLAWFRWREPGQPERWCQIQEYIPAATTLEQALTGLYRDDTETQLALVRETARQLGRLHQLGRYHGDMKLTNVLVREGKITLIDMQGGRPLRRQRWQQKDLGRFFVGLREAGVSPVQIQEAVAVYRQQSGNGDKRFMTAVERFAEKISRRRRRRYGPQDHHSPDHGSPTKSLPRGRN